MPRLIDDIRAAGKYHRPWFVTKQPEWATYAKVIWDLISDPQMPILNIDRAADYYFRLSDQENWNIVRDFPHLKPPHQLIWMEHKMPKVIHSRERGDTNVARLVADGRIGMVMYSLAPNEVKGEGIPDTCRKILWCDLFIDYGERGIQGPHGATFFALDADGMLLDRPWMQVYCGQEHSEIMKGFMTFFNPGLLAISAREIEVKSA